MRITFVMAGISLSGGVRIIAQYACRLKRRGHEVTVVARPERRPSLRDCLRDLLRDGRWRGRVEPRETFFDEAGVEVKLLESARPVEARDVPDADVVLATFWATAAWVHALPASKGVKAQFIQGYKEAEGWDDNSEHEASWRLPMRKIVVAPWLKDLAASRFGDPGAIVVPNGADVTLFHADPRGKQGVPRVGLLYHWSPTKGTDILLGAVERARREIPDLRVVSFGARKPVRSLPLPAGTEFFHDPPQSRLRDIYATCDAWLFGSRREGFGLPILEALACRTPVIGVPVGAAPQLLKDGGGTLVPPEDPEAMARAIVALCRLPEDRWKAMSDAAWSTARRYTCDDATLLFEQALQATVREPAPPRAEYPSASSAGPNVL